MPTNYNQPIIETGEIDWRQVEVSDGKRQGQGYFLQNSGTGSAKTDKNPQMTGNATKKQNRLENPTEGDPDFMRDAARIYVAQSTHGDINFLNQDKPQDDNDNK